MRYRNPDADQRSLDRAALASGDPGAAFQAWLNRRRAGGVEAPAEGPREGYRWEAPQGSMLVRPTSGEHAYVESTSPWVVNRVPLRWTAHFFLTPEGWVPHSNEKRSFRDGDEVVSRLPRMADVLHSPRLHGSFFVRRADRFDVDGRDVSHAAAQKLAPMVIAAFNAWAQAAGEGGTIHRAEQRHAHEALEKAEGLLQEAQQTLQEAQARVGAAYLAALRAGLA